jgi:hypothetical protein
MQRTEAFVEGSYRRRRISTFKKSFADFDQRSVWDGIFTPVNSKLKLFGEFGRCLFLRMSRLGNNSVISSSRGLSSSVRNDFLLNFGSSI